MRWNLLLDELEQDLRDGFPQIARNPGFMAIAVLTLAPGIGANTALFSIFNSLIVRPLPAIQADRRTAGASSCRRHAHLGRRRPQCLH